MTTSVAKATVRCEWGANIQEAQKILEARNPRALFVTPAGLTEPFVELLSLDGLHEKGDSFEDTVKKTQEKWISVLQGRGGKELTSILDSLSIGKTEERVEAIAKNLGVFDERSPALPKYDYGVCLCADLEYTRQRIYTLVKSWQEGYRFDSLVFLAGERCLDKRQEGVLKLCDRSFSPLPFRKKWKFFSDTQYETEFDMAKCLWEQMKLPKGMRKALQGKVVFVNAPRGTEPRPSTKETYICWKQTFNPKPGTVLSASSPLVWTRQHIVGENILGPSYPLDTIAPALSEDELIKKRPALVSLVHDTFAKCLYEIQTTQKL